MTDEQAIALAAVIKLAIVELTRIADALEHAVDLYAQYAFPGDDHAAEEELGPEEQF